MENQAQKSDTDKAPARKQARPKEKFYRVIFLEKGSKVEEGSAEQIFTRPAEERTRLFLSQIL